MLDGDRQIPVLEQLVQGTRGLNTLVLLRVLCVSVVEHFPPHLRALCASVVRH